MNREAVAGIKIEYRLSTLILAIGFDLLGLLELKELF